MRALCQVYVLQIPSFSLWYEIYGDLNTEKQGIKQKEIEN